MIVAIGDSAQSASIGLHRSFGFRFSGIIHSVGYQHVRWLEPLDPGDTKPADNSGKP
jgi:phosphinothricin acetyltransferase